MTETIAVLIVDDSAVSADVLRTILRQERFAAKVVLGGRERALAEMRESKPDIVCARLPLLDDEDMDTVSAFKKEIPNIPLVVISGNADRIRVQEVIGRGAIGFIVEPFTSDQVQAAMRRVREVLVKGASRIECKGSIKRIVIIEPDQQVRGELRTILEGAGYCVVSEADNGLDGLIAVDREAPDLVCLDADLPLVDGLNALNVIKACHPQIRGMLLSAHADRASVARGISIGATGYLLKPFDPAHVLHEVAQAFALSPPGARPAR